MSTTSVLKNIPVEYLSRGHYQPRRTFNEQALQELSESIRSNGVIEPIIVREISVNRYEIIAGERRWRASKLAGLHEVPVVIKDINDLKVCITYGHFNINFFGKSATHIIFNDSYC